MRLLIIAASDPYTNWHAQELLDALLVSATFGAEVSLLFQDDGIVQLLPDQDAARLGRRSLVSQLDAEDMCRRLAREEGIFAGISAAGACWVAQEIAKTVRDAVIVFVVCDRGDRYLSTGVFPA